MPVICPACRTENDDPAENCFGCGRGLYSFMLGDVLAGRYQILRLIGKGGMGLVYKAADKGLDGDVVAVKVLRPDVAGSPTMAKRFRSEIRLARKVRHKNVCGIHEYGEHAHLRYIVMDFVEGVDLKRVLKESGAFSWPVAFDVAIQIAEGLQAVHEAGIVHRDLKTPNIMRDSRGLIRLMDFGIAKSFESDGSTGATATGQILGTPEYMSPEQVRAEKLDARSDLYALGIVIHELFTGDVPFRGDTPVATLFKHLQDAPVLEGPAAEHLPYALRSILGKALAKDRRDRFSSAQEMVDALRAARASTGPEPVRPILPSIGAVAVDPERWPGGDEGTPVPTMRPTRAGTAVQTVVPTLSAPGDAEAGAVDPRDAAASFASGVVAPEPPDRPRTIQTKWLRPPPGLDGRRRTRLVAAALVGVAGVVAGAVLSQRLGTAPEPVSPASMPARTGERPPRGVSEGAANATIPFELVPPPSLPSGGAQESPLPKKRATPRPPAPEGALQTAAGAPDPRPDPSISPLEAAAPQTSPPQLVPSDRQSTPVSGGSEGSLATPAVMAQPTPHGASPTLEAVGMGTVILKIKPAAEVSVDGASVGRSPQLSLPAGPHTFEFAHQDYLPLKRIVRVRSGETVTLAVDLRDEAVKRPR